MVFRFNLQFHKSENLFIRSNKSFSLPHEKYLVEEIKTTFNFFLPENMKNDVVGKDITTKTKMFINIKNNEL